MYPSVRRSIVFAILLTAIQWVALEAQITGNGYALMMKEVFGFVCLNCHDSNLSNRSGAPSNINWDTYTLAYVSAALGNTQVQAGTMPPVSAGGALSATKKAVFQSWVTAGLPLGPIVDYDSVKAAIFTPICLNCHDSNKSGSARNGAPATVNWNNYALASASAALGNIRVQQGTMPPASAGVTLTAVQKALFQDWVNLDIPSGREVTYPALADSLLTGKCITCHDSKKIGSARLGAPTNVNFDTYTAAKASFAPANNYVQAGNHPFSSVGITAGQKLLFFDWIYAGMLQGVTGPVCDLDENGTAGVSDVIWLLLYMRDHAFDQSHDYNGDGRFSISDAVMLVLHLRNGVCRESSGMLAAAGPLAAVSRIEGLTQAQIDYLENTFDQLGLTPDEEAAFRIALYGNSGRPELPRAYSLSQNSPNPFNPATTISYTVPGGQARVTIGIFDLGGRLIRTLVDTDREAGIYTVFWNGLDEHGEPAASGVYFYCMTAGDYSQTRKMVLVK